ncbi:acetylserotonin O-methyltransferase-like [Tripterygium wilfordii]|uniref:acetylserotonin O-methyltransferase-like n=1 Tax=Tripterygium wilfordii TaxID=458696 RepID=UPI0018F80B3F|nr:acetylserotonin O-methyltransferase-like [Tripterygium wilfordii]
MGETKGDEKMLVNEEEEAQAKVDIYKYVFGFVSMAVVKCAIELGLPDILEKHRNPMTLSELSSTLGCEPSLLYRLMRFLTNERVFREERTSQGDVAYAQTALSRRLLRLGEMSMVDLIMFESNPFSLASWDGLRYRVLATANTTLLSDGPHTEAADPVYNRLFNQAMACNARATMPAILKEYKEVFNGVSTLVDVGGGNGTAMSLLVKECPWIKCINFDLPHVVSDAPDFDSVQHVGGDMFKSVPNADAVFLMRVLHNWGDDECIQVLRKCKEAIPSDKGKAIIVEAVIDEKQEGKLEKLRLVLDITMMTHTNKGKERSLEQWEYILKEAGFSRHIIKQIPVMQSVIVAFP